MDQEGSEDGNEGGVIVDSPEVAPKDDPERCAERDADPDPDRVLSHDALTNQARISAVMCGGRRVESWVLDVKGMGKEEARSLLLLCDPSDRSAAE